MAVTFRDSFHDTLAHELDVLRRAGLYRTLRRMERRSGAEVLVDGIVAVDFSSNDYLGLAADRRIAAAIRAALETQTTGAGAARSISGNHPLHEALEAELARLKGAEAALLFASGFTANVGAIPVLAGRGDAIYSDELNHASVIDGCRLSRAVTRTVPHNDLAALARLLEADEGQFRRRIIIAEGVYSMDGDLAPLDQLAALAHEHGAALYVDDAHGTGVLGATGAGSAEHWGVTEGIDIAMGTLGKALGVSGAFIAGSHTLRDFLMNRARSFIFTTGTPPAVAAGALAALAILRDEPWRRERLRANVARLRQHLADLGRPVDPELPGHVVPVIIGDADRTTAIGQTLRARGFVVGAIRPPSVPLGKARLRITLSAAHTLQQIDTFADALTDLV